MPLQGGEPLVDWRSNMPQYSRERVVDKIVDTLKRHVPFSEGPEKLKKIAEMFEEKVYTSATSQSDYLRKISVKMVLAMETKQSQKTMANPLQSNSVGNSNTPLNPDLMDSHNEPPPEAEEPSMDTGHWKSKLKPDSRKRVCSEIMDTLIMKMYLPFSVDPEGLKELGKITERFEEKLYTDATSQSDYLRKIRLTLMVAKRLNV